MGFLDGLFGGGTTKINSTTNSDNSSQSTGTQNSTANRNGTTNGTLNPAGFQMPYIMAGLNGAQSLFGSAPSYTPLTYQGLLPSTLSSLSALSAAANDGTVPYTLMGRGMTDSGALNDALARYNDAYGTISGATGGIGTAGGTLGSAATGASSLLSRSSMDPTQSNISDAGAYANNPYTQGMIQSAITPIERQLKEVALPQNNLAAAGTGNMDSSRAAMTDAILRSRAGEDEANVTSNILGSQYNNGLSLAESARNANNNLGVSSTGLLGQIGGSQGDLASRLAAIGSGQASVAGGLADIGRTGDNELTTGNSTLLNNLDIPVQGGQLIQGDMNNANKVAYDNAMTGSQFPWQFLNNYWNIVGKPLGTSTTGTTSQQDMGTSTSQQQGTSTGTSVMNGTSTAPGPSLISGLLGTAAGIGSLFTPTGAFGMGPSIASSIGKLFGGGSTGDWSARS